MCHTGNMEAPIDHLQKILDLLGPGLWLELDQDAFSRYFGGDLSRKTAEVEAQRLAKRNHCTIKISGTHVRIGRAYFKKSTDA